MKIIYHTERRFGIGEAVRLLESGEKVARVGWNGKGMFLFLFVPNEADDIKIGISTDHGEVWELPQRPVICMKDAQDHVTIGWVTSQVDILAKDYVRVTVEAEAC